MGNRVSAGFLGNLDEALGNQRTGNRGAEQVDALIDGIGTEHRKDKVADEFFSHILDEDFLHASLFRLQACRFKLFALAEVCSKGNDFSAELGLEPFQNNRGVEAAGIGEHDLFDVFMRCHFVSNPSRVWHMAAVLAALLLHARKTRNHARIGGCFSHYCRLTERFFSKTVLPLMFRVSTLETTTFFKPGTTVSQNQAGGEPADANGRTIMSQKQTGHPAFRAGNTAVITGGASGIGFAAAKAFIEFGMNVMIADVKSERLKTAGAELAALAEKKRR